MRSGVVFVRSGGSAGARISCIVSAHYCADRLMNYLRNGRWPVMKCARKIEDNVDLPSSERRPQPWGHGFIYIGLEERSTAPCIRQARRG